MPKSSTPYQRLLLLLLYVGGKLRHSKRNVPHIVTQKDGVPVSICWFAKSNLYRVFSPYQVGVEQTKTDFGDEESLKAYFKPLTPD